MAVTLSGGSLSGAKIGSALDERSRTLRYTLRPTGATGGLRLCQSVDDS